MSHAVRIMQFLQPNPYSVILRHREEAFTLGGAKYKERSTLSLSVNVYDLLGPEGMRGGVRLVPAGCD
jgi:hypothetical protein